MAELFDGKIKQRTFIAAPPERVFDVITDAGEWDEFFTTGMQLDPKPGGVCSFAWKDWGPDHYTLSVPGKVLAAERPKLFSFQWGEAGRETTIKFVLEPADGGTIVTCTEEGYKDTPQGRAMILECASGWGEACTLLKFHIEHGINYHSARRHS